MADLPSFDQWMKGTSSLLSPRSDLLKRLDEAVKTQNKESIKTALDRWRFEQSKQGKDWRKSVRNQKGLVTQLYRAVGVDKRKLGQDELEAMNYIARAQAMALQKQFAGQQLQFKATTVLGMANRAGSGWTRFKNDVDTVKTVGGTVNDVKKGVQSVIKGVHQLQTGITPPPQQPGIIKAKIMEFCKELCPGLDANTVLTTLHLGGVEHFATSLMPFVGMAKSGVKVVTAWVAVAKKGYERHGVVDSRYAFSPGDPEAAFDAVIVLLNRDLASRTAKAGIATTTFTARTLTSIFADGGVVSGPVIGLCELLAEIFQTIVEYVRDYLEVKAANEMLRLGALNLDLFSVSPSLGCYFLVIQDHSTIVNFAVGDYGTTNWMFDVEKLVGKIGAALSAARTYLVMSRYEIPGLAGSKGLVKANYSVSSGLGKVTGLKDHISSSVMDSIDGWFTKPVKPPKVDKSRIVGFGSK